MGPGGGDGGGGERDAGVGPLLSTQPGQTAHSTDTKVCAPPSFLCNGAGWAGGSRAGHGVCGSWAGEEAARYSWWRARCWPRYSWWPGAGHVLTWGPGSPASPPPPAGRVCTAASAARPASAMSGMGHTGGLSWLGHRADLRPRRLCLGTPTPSARAPGFPACLWAVAFLPPGTSWTDSAPPRAAPLQPTTQGPRRSLKEATSASAWGREGLPGH